MMTKTVAIIGIAAGMVAGAAGLYSETAFGTFIAIIGAIAAGVCFILYPRGMQ